MLLFTWRCCDCSHFARAPPHCRCGVCGEEPSSPPLLLSTLELSSSRPPPPPLPCLLLLRVSPRYSYRPSSVSHLGILSLSGLVHELRPGGPPGGEARLWRPGRRSLLAVPVPGCSGPDWERALARHRLLEQASALPYHERDNSCLHYVTRFLALLFPGLERHAVAGELLGPVLGMHQALGRAEKRWGDPEQMGVLTV